MTSTTAYDFVKSTVKSEHFAASVIFAAWIAALVSGSVLAIVAGLVAYTRPWLLVALFSPSRKTKETLSSAVEPESRPAARRLSPTFPLGLAF